MKRPSIIRRKSNVNGQTIVDMKELPKKDVKVSFADSVNNLQVKLLSNEINLKTKTSASSFPSSQEDPLSENTYRKAYSTAIKGNNESNGLNNEQGISNNLTKSNSNKIMLNQKNNQENDFRKRRSMRLSQRKSMDNIVKKKTGELSTIKEIIIGDNVERSISNNPKKRFQFVDEDNEKNKKSKKKINIIEELRKFDREQQLKMENYIDKVRKKQIELMYKNSKLYKIINNENDDEIFNNNNTNKNNKENNGINQEIKENKNENPSNEKEDTPKFNTIDNKNDNSNNINKDNNKNDIKGKNNSNNTNNKDDFQKIKEKYFSSYLFTTRFPETEYKIKYLDKFFQSNTLRKNLFANYVDDKEDNYTNNTNINNNTNNNTNINNNNNTNNNTNINNNNTNNNTNINNNNNSNINNNNNSNININNSFKTPLNPKLKDNFNNDSNIIIKKNNISPKILYKNSNETDTANTVIDSNHKYNLEQSLNSNAYTYTMRSNKTFNKYRNNDEFDNTYKMIIDSIDNKLYHRKYKNRTIFGNNITKRRIYSSNGKIKTFSRFDFNYKNNYDKLIQDKYNKYNESKMTPYFIKNRINDNNYNHSYNKDYKFRRVLGRLNNDNKQRLFNYKLI